MHGAAIIQLIIAPLNYSYFIISGSNMGIRRNPILKKNVLKQKIFIALSDATFASSVFISLHNKQH